jgi:hypothetical protein
MNILLPTPAELKQFQIKHYTKLMNNAKSFEQKIFLRKQIFNLKKDENNYHIRSYNFHSDFRFLPVVLL